MAVSRFVARSACRKCGLDDVHRATWEKALSGTLQASWLGGATHPTRETFRVDVVGLDERIHVLPNDQVIIAHVWGKEWIERRCARCGYEWVEAPLDAGA